MAEHSHTPTIIVNGRDIVADLYPYKFRHAQKQGGKVDKATVDNLIIEARAEERAGIEDKINAIECKVIGVRKHSQANEDRIDNLAILINALQMAITSPRLPAEVQDLRDKLAAQPERLNEARLNEARAKQVLRDAREAYEMDVINALLGANGAVDGKNEQERKDKRTAYLSGNADVMAAKATMDQAEGELISAALELQNVEAQESAVRNEARLFAAALQYMAGQ